MGGGLGGIAVAFLGERLLTSIAANLPRLNEVRISASMLVLSLGLSLLTSLGFGILSALRSLHVTPQRALQTSSTQLTGSKQTARSRKLLVAVEVVWRPSQFDQSQWSTYRGDGTRFLNVIARLKSGVPLSAAQSDLQRIGGIGCGDWGLGSCQIEERFQIS